jgi:tetratricopeptide (TPR) repeat protein
VTLDVLNTYRMFYILGYSELMKGAERRLDLASPDLDNAGKGKTYYILPPLSLSCFIKRPALMKELEEYSTRTHNSACPVVILLGMGGQGKSQLAMEFCRVSRAAGKFQAIFWIDGTSNNSLSRSFEDIITKISDSTPIFDNITSRVALVKDIIESWGFPWLLVFDNYDRPDEVLRISDCFPQSSFGNIIVTSRHAGSKRLGNVIQMTGMSENESLDLLFSRSGLKRIEENICEAKSVVAQLGYLPLAVDQAGAYISAQNLSMSLFSKHYKERKAHILRYTPSLTEYRKKLNDSDAETALNVFTTLELSLQEIGGSSDDRGAIENFLTLCAFFSNISIGEDLAKIAATKYRPGWMHLFISEDAWDHYKYQDAIANINHLSLLNSLSPGDAVYFSLHPLVSDWLKLRRDIPCCRTCTILSGSVLQDLIGFEDVGTMQLGPRQYLLAHIDSYFHNQRLYLDSLDFIDEVVLDQMSRFGYFLHRSSRYNEAGEMYLRAIQGYEKAFGADHPSTLDIANSLGVLFKDQGKLKKAEEMSQRALQGYEKTLGADHPSTLDTVNNLGLLYRNQGKLKEAEKMHQRALQGSEKVFGADHPSTLDTVHSLGLLYKNQGKLKEAEKLYQRALQGSEKVLGADHLSTFRIVNNLGALYQEQGKIKEAEEMLRRALQGYEKALGADHPSALRTVNNLGLVYRNQGKLKEAEEMYQRALQGREKVLGASHPSTLRTVCNLGLLYKHQGKLKEAEEMLQRGLQGFEKALGADHPSTIKTAKILKSLS